MQTVAKSANSAQRKKNDSLSLPVAFLWPTLALVLPDLSYFLPIYGRHMTYQRRKLKGSSREVFSFGRSLNITR